MLESPMSPATTRSVKQTPSTPRMPKLLSSLCVTQCLLMHPKSIPLIQPKRSSPAPPQYNRPYSSARLPLGVHIACIVQTIRADGELQSRAPQLSAECPMQATLCCLYVAAPRHESGILHWKGIRGVLYGLDRRGRLDRASFWCTRKLGIAFECVLKDSNR